MNKGLSIEEFCRNIIDYIPDAFQFPDITVPYIELEEKIFTGKNYSPSLTNKLETEIKIADKTIGRIAVHYTEDKPFIIPEERNLVSSIAETLAVQVQHINDARALHDSEELYRSIFHNHVAVKLMIDPESGNIIDANKAAAEFYGWPVDKLKKMKINQINTLKPDEIKKEMDKAQNLKRIHFRFKHRIADGTIKDVEVYGCGLEIRGKTVLHSIVHDITERVKAEKTNESLLKENRLLLRETHHRVKNNMNTLHALLYVQAEEQRDPAGKKVLNDAADRVKGMMILYDKLYRPENINEFSADNFFVGLLNEIIKVYNTGSPVKTEVKINNLELDSKTLSTLGIIINELTINSLKYAFTGINEGLISLSAEKNGDKIKIIYRDNGIGLPENFDIDNSTGFGMYLIKMLLEIIGGTIEFEKSKGAKFIITL
jgi:PAS domain S-box-containing protein